MVGCTFAYTAPEVMAGGRASPAADLFAFGLVVFDLHFPPAADGSMQRPMFFVEGSGATTTGRSPACVQLPSEYPNALLEEPLKELIEALTSRDPSRRPSASEALAMEYFRVLLVDGGDANTDLRACVVHSMGDGERDTLERDGVTCDEGHFTCAECLTNSIKAMSNGGVARWERTGGEVRCPFGGYACESSSFALEKVCGVCRDAEALQTLVKIREEMAAHHMKRQMDEEHRRELVSGGWGESRRR